MPYTRARCGVFPGRDVSLCLTWLLVGTWIHALLFQHIWGLQRCRLLFYSCPRNSPVDRHWLVVLFFANMRVYILELQAEQQDNTNQHSIEVSISDPINTAWTRSVNDLTPSPTPRAVKPRQTGHSTHKEKRFVKKKDCGLLCCVCCCFKCLIFLYLVWVLILFIKK